MTNWIRPESVDFPTIWRTFEGNKSINGFRRKYWIQDLTDEYQDEAIHHMIDFLREEKIFKCGGVPDDPVSLEEFINVFNRAIKRKVSLICLTKDDNGHPHLAGCNILGVSRKEVPKSESKLNFKGKALNMVVSSIMDVSHMKDIYSELNIDTYLRAYGLYVLPAYRGEGIGTELLKARRDLSLAVGLKASVTLFSTNGGQRSAEKAGFKDFITFPYAYLNNFNPSYKFIGLENDSTKLLRVMYATYSE